jgi:hypothetical protein
MTHNRGGYESSSRRVSASELAAPPRGPAPGARPIVTFNFTPVQADTPTVTVRPKLTDQLVVRIPKNLHDALQRDAEDNGRTVAQSVRFHLSRALKP